MSESPKPGTDSGRGARKERAPGPKPVTKPCDWSPPCKEPRVAGRGNHLYCAIHAPIAREERPRKAKAKFNDKLGDDRLDAVNRHYKRRSRTRARTLDLDVPSAPLAARASTFHVDDASQKLDALRLQLDHDGPVTSVREGVFALQERVAQEMMRGAARTRLIMDCHEMLRGLSDVDRPRRNRLLEAYYASLKGAESAIRSARYFIDKAYLLWTADRTVDAAQRVFRQADDARLTLSKPPVALSHLLTKLRLRIATDQVFADPQRVEQLLALDQETDSPVIHLDTAKEMVGYEKSIKSQGHFDRAERWLEMLKRFAPHETTPYSRFPTLRAEISLWFAMGKPLPAVPLLIAYRRLCERYLSERHIKVFHDLSKQLHQLGEDIGPIPTWSGVRINLIY